MTTDNYLTQASMDMPAHVKTYTNFTKFVRVAAVSIAVLLIFMAIVLV